MVALVVEEVVVVVVVGEAVAAARVEVQSRWANFVAESQRTDRLGVAMAAAAAATILAVVVVEAATRGSLSCVVEIYLCFCDAGLDSFLPIPHTRGPSFPFPLTHASAPLPFALPLPFLPFPSPFLFLFLRGRGTDSRLTSSPKPGFVDGFALHSNVTFDFFPRMKTRKEGIKCKRGKNPSNVDSNTYTRDWTPCCMEER